LLFAPTSAHRALLSRALIGASFAALLFSAVGPASAQSSASKNLAPGFTQFSKSAKVVVMPVDVELFSISAGGVAEPKADWTSSAVGHMKTAMVAKTTAIGLNTTVMEEAAADEFGEQVGLHAAVARAIAVHHGVGGAWALPTKEGKLDWSFADSMQPIQAKTGSRYGLFVWVRDSYASPERKALMIGMALLGVGLTGGIQTGYATLVDLESGQVLWFNRLVSSTGDLRDAKSAVSSIDSLLAGFPTVQ
jgi:hypothetical protein